MSKLGEWFREKFNTAQPIIAQNEGSIVGSSQEITYKQAFEKLEAVNRGVSMIVSACSSLEFDVKQKILDNGIGIRQKTLYNLLNIKPNPYQTVQQFRQAIYTDFLIDGNAFMYYDGAYLFHVPAMLMDIIPDPKTFVKEYIYDARIHFKPSDILHFKDLSVNSIYRGDSRLKAATRNINILYKMQTFQENFFKNGAVPGLVLTSDNTLSQVAKTRTIASWIQGYNPDNGARKPLILDSGLKPSQLSNVSFKEMDFDLSVKSHNVKILETLGVPPVLLDGGNQANISPNLRLFYLETVLPIIRQYVSAIESFFGYDVDFITNNISALQPEIKDTTMFLTGLVNGGLITPNEGRAYIRYEKDNDPESDKLRIPQNIAGSAVNPSLGGAPKKPNPA